jgi:Concanavalin A-like lectin/glucanases superfamily
MLTLLLTTVNLAGCPVPTSDTLFEQGSTVGLSLDAGRLLLAADATAVPSDAGLPVTFPSREGIFVSPVLENAQQNVKALNWMSLRPTGRALPDNGGSENFVVDTVSLAGNVALYHLDEASWTGTSGEVKDTSGQNNHGVAIGDAGVVKNGVFLAAGAFSPESCVSVPDAPSLRPTTAVTYAAWFSSRELNVDAQGLLSKRVDYQSSSSFTLYLDTDSRLYVDIDTENDRFASISTLEPNRWYHAAVVFDGSKPQAERVRLYVNGMLDTVAKESSTSISPFTAPLSLGCLPLPTVNRLQSLRGTLDEVAIFNRALSADEVGALYRRGAGRISAQYRGCLDATCATNPPWLGSQTQVGDGVSAEETRLEISSAQPFFQFRFNFRGDLSGQPWPELTSVTVEADCPDAGLPPQSDAGLLGEDAGDPPVLSRLPLDLKVSCGCEAVDALSLLSLFIVTSLVRLRRRRI